MIEVTGPDDPRLSDFHGVRLRDDRHFPFFIAEGRAAVAELVQSPYPVRAVLLLDRKAASAEARRVRDLERELQRKEKALAEAAALLVLKKKAQAIWGDEDDDTDPKNDE